MRATKAPPSNAALQRLYAYLYAQHGNHFFTTDTRDITEEVLAACQWENKRVLDLGCGSGYTAARMQRQGATVVAVDGEQVDSLPTHYPVLRADVQTYCAELPEASFDIIVMQEVLEHLDEPAWIIKQCAYGLRPGGALIVTCPSFLNVRGYIWMTLALLCGAQMSLTDLHYLMPWEIEQWGLDARLEPISWQTFRHKQAHGDLLIHDFAKRLPKAYPEYRILDTFLAWLEQAIRYEADTLHNGACALYHFVKPITTGGDV